MKLIEFKSQFYNLDPGNIVLVAEMIQAVTRKIFKRTDEEGNPSPYPDEIVITVYGGERFWVGDTYEEVIAKLEGMDIPTLDPPRRL